MRWEWLTVDRVLWAAMTLAVLWGANTLAGIGDDISNLDTNVTDLRERVAVVETRLDSVESNVEILRGDVSYLVRLHAGQEKP